MYRNGKIGVAEHTQLDELIRSNKIKKFLRSEGWVTVGTDPIRLFDEGYQGTDKRSFLKRFK